jgi:hypothetical protein
MSRPSFFLKLARADEHLQELQREIVWFAASDPYTVRYETDEEGRRHVWMGPVGNAPVRVALLAGDIVHNLHSGLDHLALALSEANAGGHVMPRVERDSEFPIFIERDKFRKGRAKRIGMAASRAQALIQRAQPYRRWQDPSSHPLWQLYLLSNYDKHRRLPIASMCSIRSPLESTA